MSNHEKSLDGPNNDPRNAVTVEDQAAFSQNQWTSMRGDRDHIGAGAVGGGGKIFDRQEDFDPEKGGFSHIGRGFTEGEKRRIITSAVRGAESVEDLAQVKHLERFLDHRKDPEDKGFIDCFGDIYKRMQAEKAKDVDFAGEIGGSIGFGATADGDRIGRKIGDGAQDGFHDAHDFDDAVREGFRHVYDIGAAVREGFRDALDIGAAAREGFRDALDIGDGAREGFRDAHDVGDAAREGFSDAHDVGDAARGGFHDAHDIGAGIAGQELKGRDDGTFLPPADNGDSLIGIVPANNPYYSGR